VYVHSDIDIVHQIMPAGYFKLFPALVAVNAAKHYLALPQRLPAYPATSGEALNKCIRLQTVNHLLSEMEFWGLGERVSQLSADKAVEVRLLNKIVVIGDITLKSKMGQLLHDVPPPPPKPGTPLVHGK
jgi:hypothetical protein